MKKTISLVAAALLLASCSLGNWFPYGEASAASLTQTKKPPVSHSGDVSGMPNLANVYGTASYVSPTPAYPYAIPIPEGGSASAINDGNLSTFDFVGGGGSWTGGVTYDAAWQVSLPRTFSVTSAIAYFNAAAGGDGVLNAYLQLLISGVWTTIASQTGITSAGFGGPLSASGSWSNVTGVRIYFVYTAGTSSPNSPSMNIYEVEANGPNYADSGLWLNHSSGIVKLGMLSPATSTAKLRLRKGGTTVELPLVSTTSYDASPVRFYDGATVYALAKVVT